MNAFTFTELAYFFFSDKTVFGVPLMVTLQRTGHSLPKPVQSALNWLKNNALDQVRVEHYTLRVEWSLLLEHKYMYDI